MGFEGSFILFEDLKYIDENGFEYWRARDLQVLLQYNNWNTFEKLILNTVENYKKAVFKDFFFGNSIVSINGDYKLSRFLCYLIMMNADPRKKNVALCKKYFAIQTRRTELIEERYKKYNVDFNNYDSSKIDDSLSFALRAFRSTQIKSLMDKGNSDITDVQNKVDDSIIQFLDNINNKQINNK